ncbi:PP2C family protein-serine/threonine phosphatase [Dyella mobilis]|uniref:Serine/threonine-protein phosphatase n=1 Tax=Dyella mobilis TaxID=1849582 RepID=A0ABS2KIF3_9GAMM|nr:protein phosphatase 2C domain-containing protein [Dyella mobilis]MBM7130931.1 serine/threonine-protein phosphatase [Dyella mobilis]GLQ97560.1 protein phosphatase [Dyella mobilis]
MIEFGHGTHVGLRRTRNEDTYYADAALGLFLVADGMGGHQHGEVASALARDAVVEGVRRAQPLVEAIQNAAATVIKRAQRYDDALPMGSTMAAIRISEQGYEVAWVGDSRIYQWKNGLRQISHDHSLVQNLVKAGVIDESQAKRHPQRNVLTQALGITAPGQLHISMAKGSLSPGMSFLVCSDGLTEEVGDETIASIVGREDLAAQECIDHLLLAALDHGGSDNVTAILARMR